jgi:N-acetylmuramoyl-L-alanine amidase
MKFFIDPGHRWPKKDRGAAGILSEEGVVLPVAQALQQILIKRGHEVKMLQIGDAVESVQESLSARVQQSNDYSPDLYISIHANANSATDRPMGTEAFALSRGAIAIAQKFIDGMVSKGFKRREVKTGDDAGHLYVLTHTEDPAVLLELFFIDSVADCEVHAKLGSFRIAEVIADAVAPIAASKATDHNPSGQNLTEPVTSVNLGPIVTPASSGKKVSQIIADCDTGLARGLSLQLIAKMAKMSKSPLLVELKHPLINTSSPAVNPYLQPAAAAALIKAVESRGIAMTINSCLRTTVQQHIIKQQHENGCCGITAAAAPGRSNHERGLALDIQDPDDWQEVLEGHNWSRLGSWDYPHYDFFDGRNDIASIQISAFQALWNVNNPNELLAVDGVYGDVTGRAIERSPIDGFAKIT